MSTGDGRESPSAGAGAPRPLSASTRHLAEGKRRDGGRHNVAAVHLPPLFTTPPSLLLPPLPSMPGSGVPLLSFSPLSPPLHPGPASCPQPGAVTQGFCHRHRGFEPRASGPAAPLVFIPAANAGIILHLANAINFPVG